MILRSSGLFNICIGALGLTSVVFLVFVATQKLDLSRFTTVFAKEEKVLAPKHIDSGFSAFAAKLEPIYSKPKLLVFKSQELKIVEVGVDKDGYLETPKDWMIAGWFKRSSMPGQVGNMIINAHYDDNYGRPAAFWSLKTLTEDDKVSVTDEYGKVHSYKVFKVFYVNINDPKRLDVLEDVSNDSILTLITCGGVWLSGAHTYDHRLVVQARLELEVF
jgi:LPXTG-site transpeptidase (sortase) family protein